MKTITVYTAVYDLLRAYNMTTFFGNPGSTGKREKQNPPVEQFTDFVFLQP